jgi:hypothetical protein
MYTATVVNVDVNGDIGPFMVAPSFGVLRMYLFR